jgi:DNA-binding transcriptional MerR regulator
MADRNHPAAGTPTYRSGAVARLTGIPVETLRVWERRYNVVGPRQSPTGQRLYSPEAVTRLTVIKQLVDSGHAIGSIAALDLDQLQSMLRSAARAPLAALRPSAINTEGLMAPSRLAIVGEALALRVERHRLPTLQVVAVSPTAARAGEVLRGITADALLIELPTLQRETPQVIRGLAQQLSAQRIVVEYGFSAKHIEQELRAMGLHLVHAPLDIDQLESLCRVPRANPAAGATLPAMHMDSVPPRRFDSRALAEIAMVSVTLNCECPHHLADLLVRLGNFETYSAECEIRSPADAALHQYLKQATGSARALLEVALAHLIDTERISLSA